MVCSGANRTLEATDRGIGDSPFYAREQDCFLEEPEVAIIVVGLRLQIQHKMRKPDRVASCLTVDWTTTVVLRSVQKSVYLAN